VSCQTALYAVHGNPSGRNCRVHGKLLRSILFDVEETDLERTYEDDQELFERLKNYGWPCAYTTVDDLVATLKAKHIKAFAISSSYGLDRWVWAEQMTKVQRDSCKQFT
jgi:hypothetical protein